MPPQYIASGIVKPTRPMAESEIADLIAAYARGAKNAQVVGFDSVAIHGAHGNLIDTFFWAETNKRTDAYGGDLVARTRFGSEVVSAIRAAVGPNFPIVFRYSQWKQPLHVVGYSQYARTLSDTDRISAPWEDER